MTIEGGKPKNQEGERRTPIMQRKVKNKRVPSWKVPNGGIIMMCFMELGNITLLCSWIANKNTLKSFRCKFKKKKKGEGKQEKSSIKDKVLKAVIEIGGN